MKRLSHGWSLRASFGYNDWRKDVGPGAIVDPNNFAGEATPAERTPAMHSPASAPSGSTRIGSSTSAARALPLGITVAANFFGRQGFVQPYFVNVQTHDTRESVPWHPDRQVDSYRLPDVYQLDLHVEKLLRIGSRVTVTPLLDCFNAVNSHTVLGRDGRVGGWDHGAEEPFEPAERVQRRRRAALRPNLPRGPPGLVLDLRGHGRWAGLARLPLGGVVYFLRSAVQSVSRVIGGETSSPEGLLTRNRWPSAEAS